MKRAKWGSKRERTVTQAHDTWMGWRAQTLEPMSCDTSIQVRAVNEKKVTCGVLFTPPVGCSRLPSAVNEPTTTNQKIIMSSTIFPNSTMKNWKKTGATFGIVEKGLVLDVLLLVLGGGGSLLWLRFGSLIVVSAVHSCPICSVWDANVFDI